MAPPQAVRESSTSRDSAGGRIISTGGSSADSGISSAGCTNVTAGSRIGSTARSSKFAVLHSSLEFFSSKVAAGGRAITRKVGAAITDVGADGIAKAGAVIG
jgi:hypothetical protein